MEYVLLKLARLRSKSVCSPSYVEFRPKTNAVILLDMGHTLRVVIEKDRKPKT
jgi:hypothetical protein